jgi:hypothetical protein
LPCDSVFDPSELSAVTGTSPAANALLIWGTWSSGAVNTTEIGCSFTIVTMPIVSVAWTMLPGSIKRKPAFPDHRRPDGRVTDLSLGVVNSSLIAFDLRIQLVDGGLLSIKLLAGGEFLFVESGIALEVQLRILQIRLVLRLFRECLIKSRLIGPRINQRKKIALVDHLSLFGRNLRKFSVDAAMHSDGFIRLHGSEPVQIYRKIGRLRECDTDRDCDFAAAIRLTPLRRLLAVPVKMTPAETERACD